MNNKKTFQIENRTPQEVVNRYYVHTKRYRGPKKIAKRREEQNDNIMFSYQQQLEQIVSKNKINFLKLKIDS